MNISAIIDHASHLVAMLDDIETGLFDRYFEAEEGGKEPDLIPSGKESTASLQQTLLTPRVLFVAPMTFKMTQQRIRTICNSTLIAIFVHLEKFKGQIRLQECKILSSHWIMETALIEVLIVRPNLHVNISEQFTIRECMRPSFEGSVNMDL